MKDSEKGFAALGMLVGGFAVIVGAIVVRGWALSILWGWFVVPVFKLPVLGIAQAVGLAFLVGMLVPDKDRDWPTTIGRAFLTPLLTLGFAWIVHLFC